MARIFWDGEKIVATACTANITRLTELAEKYKAETLPAVNGYGFNRTSQTILDLSTLEQTVLDPSFEELLDKVNKVNQNKLKQIEDLHLPDIMYQFQKETVAQIVKWNHNVLLASDMGTGKSCMASVSLSKLPDAYPALVVCPASLKLNWEMELNKWTPDIKTFVIDGRSSYMDSYVVNKAKQADVIIMNYDILGIDDKEAQKREKERIKIAKENGWKYRKSFIPVSGWVDIINNELNIKTIICDECQYIESQKAIRTRAVIQISSNPDIKKLFLSGTPFETRVSQFYTACHIIAPDLFPKEWDFKQRYCAPYYNGFGWTYNGVSNLDELRRKLNSFMIRHKKEDVLTQLPQKQKIPIYLDMDKTARKHYDDMEDELMSLDEGIHQFSYLAKMKEALTEIKIDSVIQFIKDTLEVEDKVVVFAYHTSVFETLMNNFKGMCVGINGGVSTFKRQDAVNKFQNDPDVRVFIGQVQAAATGITLTASHIVIFAEFGTTTAQMSQAADRIHRIGQKENCLIYYLIVKDTIEEHQLELLNQHSKDIDAVMNGDTDSEMLSFDQAVIASVKTRRLMKNRQGVQIEYN